MSMSNLYEGVKVILDKHDLNLNLILSNPKTSQLDFHKGRVKVKIYIYKNVAL